MINESRSGRAPLGLVPAPFVLELLLGLATLAAIGSGTAVLLDFRLSTAVIIGAVGIAGLAGHAGPRDSWPEGRAVAQTLLNGRAAGEHADAADRVAIRLTGRPRSEVWLPALACCVVAALCVVTALERSTPTDGLPAGPLVVVAVADLLVRRRRRAGAERWLAQPAPEPGGW